MSGVPIALVGALMTESLAAWHVAGNVEETCDRVVVICSTKQIGIEPAAADSMFRWLVTIDGRTRSAISLLAVLRQVREALDPGYAANPLRVAVAPLVLS
jgi:hypothetical protein